MKGRTVNIPLFEKDVLNTVQSLPRTPTEAGIIPVNFKRKLSYKNNHLLQYVSVPKIIKALKTLKELGNEYYQFIPETIDFKQTCKENDIDGFNFLFPKETNIEESVFPEKEQDTNENSCDPVVIEGDKEIDEDSNEKEEDEYIKNDSVKKWQFEYNKSTCFSHNYPEINYKEDNSDNTENGRARGNWKRRY